MGCLIIDIYYFFGARAVWLVFICYFFFLLGLSNLVAPAEATANAADAQAVEEPPSARFTWKIENFSKLNMKKQYSEVFVVGGYKWYLIFSFSTYYLLALCWS